MGDDRGRWSLPKFAKAKACRSGRGSSDRKFARERSDGREIGSGLKRVKKGQNGMRVSVGRGLVL